MKLDKKKDVNFYPLSFLKSISPICSTFMFKGSFNLKIIWPILLHSFIGVSLRQRSQTFGPQEGPMRPTNIKKN